MQILVECFYFKSEVKVGGIVLWWKSSRKIRKLFTDFKQTSCYFS